MILRLLAGALLCVLSVHAVDARPRRPMPPALHRVMAEGAGRTVGYALISRARSYLGTNPTGWRHVWCARFMAMIAPGKAAHLRNPNSARAWVHAGRRLRSCRVGAIAVMARGPRGGHVGVVTSCGPRGPTVVSGNHGHRVGEGRYSERRVLAYVDPRPGS
jgi:uncharacterized protein (TIGR02594 family)